MDKTGQVEEGITPCVTCGRQSEIIHSGEAYCMSCFLKKKYQVPPMQTKLASDQRVRSVE